MRYLKKIDADGITKLDTGNVLPRVLEMYLFLAKRSKIKLTRHKILCRHGVCTFASAGFFQFVIFFSACDYVRWIKLASLELFILYTEHFLSFRFLRLSPSDTSIATFLILLGNARAPAQACRHRTGGNVTENNDVMQVTKPWES